MTQSIIFYFFQRLFFYFWSFIDTYFRGGFIFFNNWYWQLFFRIERRLGFLANVRYFFIPLWQQYSTASYILSIPIRTFKIIIGAIGLGIFSIIFWLGYLIWILAPVYLITKIIRK